MARRPFIEGYLMTERSSSLSIPRAPSASAAESRLSRIGALLTREPLVHFVILGGLIFAIDAALHPPKKDERVIVVGKALRQSFIDGFDEDKARTPTDADLQKMIDSWVASEILYREGKAMGVDRGDEMIRDRVAYKLQLLIFDQIKLSQPTEKQLRDWFEANRARFDEPETVGFYITLPMDEASARIRLADIEAQRESDDMQKSTRAALARPLASIAPAFGTEFRDGLLALPEGRWSILRSNDGWNVVRLDSRRPGAPADFEQHRDDVLRMWRADETRKRALEAVARLKASYSVRIEQ